MAAMRKADIHAFLELDPTHIICATGATIRDLDPEIERIAIGRFPWLSVDPLRAQGLTMTDTDKALAPARAIKLDIAPPFFRDRERLEKQYLITETGVECMSAYPFEDRLSGRMI